MTNQTSPHPNALTSARFLAIATFLAFADEKKVNRLVFDLNSPAMDTRRLASAIHEAAKERVRKRGEKAAGASILKATFEAPMSDQNAMLGDLAHMMLRRNPLSVTQANPVETGAFRLSEDDDGSYVLEFTKDAGAEFLKSQAFAQQFAKEVMAELELLESTREQQAA